MSRLVTRILLAFVLAVVGLLRLPVVAPVQADTCQNGGSGDTGEVCTNEGDAEAGAEQQGSSGSGDAVGGQTVGVVSDGDTSIDATNRSDGVDVTTGDATGSNTANSSAFAGVIQNPNASDSAGLGLTEQEAFFLLQIIFGGNPPPEAEEDPVGFLEDLFFGDSATCTNEGGIGELCTNDGDADATNSQSADSNSGDGVGGQIIGVVTRRGRAELVMSNVSVDSSVETGDSEFTNTGTADSTASVLEGAGFVSSPK